MQVHFPTEIDLLWDLLCFWLNVFHKSHVKPLFFFLNLGLVHVIHHTS